MTYFLLTEGMDAERRKEIDELLEGPSVVTHRQRATEMAGVGGEVRRHKRVAVKA